MAQRDSQAEILLEKSGDVNQYESITRRIDG
jgi:hypothetical protein